MNNIVNKNVGMKAMIKINDIKIDKDVNKETNMIKTITGNNYVHIRMSISNVFCIQ